MFKCGDDRELLENRSMWSKREPLVLSSQECNAPSSGAGQHAVRTGLGLL